MIDDDDNINSAALSFVNNLGQRIVDREALFLFQRISVAIQRFNSMFFTIHSASTVRTNRHSSSVFNFSFYSLGSSLPRYKNNNNTENNKANRMPRSKEKPH